MEKIIIKDQLGIPAVSRTDVRQCKAVTLTAQSHHQKSQTDVLFSFHSNTGAHHHRQQQAQVISIFPVFSVVFLLLLFFWFSSLHSTLVVHNKHQTKNRLLANSLIVFQLLFALNCNCFRYKWFVNDIFPLSRSIQASSSSLVQSFSWCAKSLLVGCTFNQLEVIESTFKTIECAKNHLKLPMGTHRDNFEAVPMSKLATWLGSIRFSQAVSKHKK